MSSRRTSPKPPKRKIERWAISRIRGDRAELVGVIEAADADAAVWIAIERFNMTDPKSRKRLAAHRLA